MNKLLKKIVAVIMVLTMFIPVFSMGMNVSAATFGDINKSNVFVKQLPPPDESCTASAAASMLRRYSMLRGDANWSSITRRTTLNVCWIEGTGMKWNFTYSDSANGINGISVSYNTLPGNSSNISTLINLLASHPEGIVIYNGSHAVILTDYTNGTFYCNDPGYDRSYERIPASQAYSVKPENATKYWYVTSPRVYIADPHTCSYSSSVTKAATCNATGVRTYKCSCGKSYTETIAKNSSNHAGGEVIKNAVAATPSSTGYTGDTYCKGCNVLLKKGTTIPKIDETQWVYTSTLPSHVTTSKYEIEYNNIYKKIATTAPDSTWTKGTLAKTEYVNDGNTYESDFELSTSNTRVLVNYYYYHWCGSSTGNYVNFAYTDSFNHYDAYPEPNAVIEESSVADSDDSRYIAYKLAWAHDPSGHCYCAPALTCDSSNSHTTRSCWWYKRYVYQNKKAVKYYEFSKESGWSEQKDSSANVVEYRYKLRDGYTVSYNANGGSGAPSSQTKTTGQKLTLSSTTPTRSGYTFKCWNTKSDGSGTNYYAGGTYSANANVTLYAQWTANSKQFKVTYNANGGTSILQYEYVEEGNAITLTTPFKYFKINYDANGGANAPSTNTLSVGCLGWSTSSNATTATYKCESAYKPTSNVTLYAVWEKSVRTNLSSQQPVREGYTFLGWSENPNATEASFSSGESVDVSGNATLYAVWGTGDVNTGYSFWEWIIIIVFFGWIWYI